MDRAGRTFAAARARSCSSTAPGTAPRIATIRKASQFTSALDKFLHRFLRHSFTIGPPLMRNRRLDRPLQPVVSDCRNLAGLCQSFVQIVDANGVSFLDWGSIRLSTAPQVEFQVLRESLRYPKGRTRSSVDCSRGPAHSLEVRSVAPSRDDIPAKKTPAERHR